RHAHGGAFEDAIRRSDLVVFQGHLMTAYPELDHTDKVVVADIYDPFPLEVLEQSRDLPPTDRYLATNLATASMNNQLRRADFFLCASEKQRDYWLGSLAALGRINPATYDDSESLERLLAVVPFGVSDEVPRRTKPALKGVVDGIGPDDRVILWGGGVY